MVGFVRRERAGRREIQLLLAPLLLLVACGDDDSSPNNNNSNQAICGNGVVDPGEQCDQGPGNSDVQPDACRTDCRSARCGDAVIDTGEACEGSDLAGASCAGQGYTGGTLSCDAQCQLDPGGCTRCGDGVAEGVPGEPGHESCDGTDLREASCASEGRPLGELACQSDCTFDFSRCTGALPVITGIEGTGPSLAIAPRAEDATAFDQVTNKRLASRRIEAQDRVLVVSGDNLAGAVSAQAVGQDGQGTVDFEIESGGTNAMVRIRFPQALTVTRGGMFLLTLVSAYGPAQAQVFFLQGEPGRDGANGVCTNAITGDLSVTGNIVAGGRIQAGLPPECPPGYTRDAMVTEFVLCEDLQSGDEMVRVGDFWVDRYESSLWQNADCSGTQYGTSADNYPATFPDTGNFQVPVYACSVTGVTPSRNMTWFQAQAACAAMGKHLCSNAEWQAAAEGTHDPGSNPGGTGPCNTAGSAPRATGQAGGTPGGTNACMSIWGAEDMIGNLWEWTAEWWIAGQTWQAADGESHCAAGCTYGGGWPAGFFGDATFSLNGEAFYGGVYTNGLPAGGLRGGYWADDEQAGAFSINLNVSPATSRNYVGVRCCR